MVERASCKSVAELFEDTYFFDRCPDPDQRLMWLGVYKTFIKTYPGAESNGIVYVQLHRDPDQKWHKIESYLTESTGMFDDHYLVQDLGKINATHFCDCRFVKRESDLKQAKSDLDLNRKTYNDSPEAKKGGAHNLGWS